MCIGIPMQVIESGEFHAICIDGEERHQVDTTLVGQPLVGDWLLVFLGAAREVLAPETAQTMRDAVQAVSHIMNGEDQIDHLFGDLIGRQPQVPDHLAHLIPDNTTKEA